MNLRKPEMVETKRGKKDIQEETFPELFRLNLGIEKDKYGNTKRDELS